MTLDEISEKNLEGVHPDLVKVVRRAAEITDTPFRVIEGLRTMAQQRHNVAHGASQTLKSRHLDGHAVDIAPLIDGKVTFAWPPYFLLDATMKRAALDVRVPIEWGGDWRKFKDGPHFQLPWAQYPST